MTMESSEKAFKASWIDRFTHWVEKLPLRPWLFYLLMGLLLIGVQLLFLSLDGGLGAVELLPVILFNALAVPYLLALIQLLDRQAVEALKAMKPVLSMRDEEFEGYAYELSTMPVLAPLATGLLMVAVAIITAEVAVEPESYAALAQLPLFSPLFLLVDISSAFLFGAFFYHTIRQLRLVNEVYTGYVRIELFNLKPVQAFSRLTTSTALGFLVFLYSWMIISPEILADPLILGLSVGMTILAVIVFVWPLWGAHRLMETEKEDVLHEIDQRSKALFARFNEHLSAGDYAAAEELTGLITSIEIQHRRISEIPTWPWRSEMAQVVLTAIALPLMLMIVQFFVQQALE